MAELLNCSVDSISRSFKNFNLEVLNDVRYGSMARYKLDRDYFEVIDTEEKAYWLGFIMADGCVTHSYSKASETYQEKRYDRLTITLAKKDYDHLIKFAKDIGYSGIVETGESFNFGKTHEYARLRITSVKLCTDLINKNVYPKKSGKEEPFELPDKLKKHYLRGYFDGDGYFSIYKRKIDNHFSSEFGFLGSFEMIKYFKNYLKEKGLNTKATINSFGEEIYIFKTGGYDVMKKLYDIIYKDSSVFLERKKQTIRYYLKHRKKI